ncbi:hypothetical protein VVAX_06737 [Variovorax paradoxus]|uniref:Uncharacterized protein n=1 Tax=Variovorax paradoxus TaxID=34073 RepID=A0A679JWJ7_VARPD|nr:hypothetical protein VVAX_06737 [Variovorax paradoxus]
MERLDVLQPCKGVAKFGAGLGEGARLLAHPLLCTRVRICRIAGRGTRRDDFGLRGGALGARGALLLGELVSYGSQMLGELRQRSLFPHRGLGSRMRGALGFLARAVDLREEAAFIRDVPFLGLMRQAVACSEDCDVFLLETIPLGAGVVELLAQPGRHLVGGRGALARRFQLLAQGGRRVPRTRERGFQLATVALEGVLPLAQCGGRFLQRSLRQFELAAVRFAFLAKGLVGFGAGRVPQLGGRAQDRERNLRRGRTGSL